MSSPLIYVALDTNNFEFALAIAKKITSDDIGLKLGLEFFNNFGVDGVKRIVGGCTHQPSVFLDLKFHDIPNTVAGAVRGVAGIDGIDYINVHASGGAEMMKAALDAAENKVKVIGVTVLTSLDDQNLQSVGQQIPAQEQVLTLAKLAQETGVGGVVCSPLEIEQLRAELEEDFVLITPGIRPAESSAGDQKRIMTPKKALELGGTITGEHGIGLNKKEYLLNEHSSSINLMKLIKKSIDPKNIMNPGKIFDI